MLLCSYHDEEWGRLEHDDNKLFELLILEGAQVRHEHTLWPTQKSSTGSRVAMPLQDTIAALLTGQFSLLLLAALCGRTSCVTHLAYSSTTQHATAVAATPAAC
jgi:hypothetical protein